MRCRMPNAECRVSNAESGNDSDKRLRHKNSPRRRHRRKRTKKSTMNSDRSALYRLDACEAARMLGAGDITPREMVEAAAARIEAVEPHTNALITTCIERALDHARRIEKGEAPKGRLGGLPIAIKDLNPVAGVRTTYGSPIYADHIPKRSDVLVERAEADGGIVIAKSNTPEFGAGASTFNEVHGKTRNPWNTSRSVAGSSGGSAAALAAGEVWLAQGSDLGGSLRIPGSFNGVVGLRPSPGRVARGLRNPYGGSIFDTLAVDGPMARTVADCALFLDSLCGVHDEDPLSLPPPATPFLDAARGFEAPRRIGFSRDLGIVPVDPEVADICAAAVKRWSQEGVEVEEAQPDFSESIESFQTLRAAYFAASHALHLEKYRDRLKPEVVWNIEKGLAIDAAQIGQAEVARARLVGKVARFFEDFDLLLCPTVLVPPFDVDVRYVEEVQGHRFDNYVHWLALTFAITLTGCPALSLPVGMTATGLPVGLQIMAPARAEAALLSASAHLEGLLECSKMTPVDPKDAHGRNLLD